MAIIAFHGDLKRFESEPFRLDVASFPELVSGLITQIDGFREKLRKGYYRLKIGKKHYNTDELKSNPNIQLNDDTEIHLTPVIVGAGKAASALQIVVGIIIIAVAWWNPGNWAAGMQLMFGAMGASMALSGAVGLLTKTPQPQAIQEGEKEKSTSFSNLKNLTPQGRPIPLLYGRMMVSMILISQGIESFDEQTIEKMKKAEEERKNPPPANNYHSSHETDHDGENWENSDSHSSDDKSESERYGPDSYEDREPDRYSPDSYDDHESDSSGGSSDSGGDYESEGR